MALTRLVVASIASGFLATVCNRLRTGLGTVRGPPKASDDRKRQSQLGPIRL